MSMNLAINNLACQRQLSMLFENISFQVRSGEVLFVEGPNGAGKSSLLRLMAGLATPTSGTVCWQNKNIHHQQTNFSEHLHYLGHQNGIKLGLTVVENIKLAGHLNGISHIDEKNILTVLSSLELNKNCSTLARHLSAGQKRRLALTKLFLFSKKIWLLDEPFTALDIASKAFLTSKLEEHLQSGGICVMSTHHRIELSQVKTQTLRLGSAEPNT